MKHLILLLSFITAFSNFSLAQEAPNFTITDTNGNVHRLYEDYLDKGKTVVIDIFFVGCPPCADIAPFMEELYQDWGAGQYDVEFFELSRKQSDFNSSVATWKEQLGLTYNGAGFDGGAYDAVKPYLDGDFGTFFGSPTFVVISPDKTVQFDVRGSGISGKIDAVDQAIKDSGAVGQGIDVQPTNYVFNMKDAFGNPINDVDITLTSANGIGATYQLNASDGDVLSILNIEDQFPDITNPTFFFSKESSDLTEKVSSIDLINILKHIIAIEPFNNPYIIEAADANGDGFVSSTDLLLLRKIIIGIEDSYPNGSSVWKAVPATIEVVLEPDTTKELDIRVIRTGDTNDF